MNPRYRNRARSFLFILAATMGSACRRERSRVRATDARDRFCRTEDGHA